MARTKEFDPDAALSAALDLFWERGYEATSMADLVDHLGIGRASIYATFGNKHELYMKALAQYENHRDPSPTAMLSQPGQVLPTVRALIDSYVEEAIHDERRRGCMVVNTAAELLPRDPEAARRVEASWDAVERALESALTRARAQGELGPYANPRSLARFLLVFLQGVTIVGKSPGDPERISDAARHALDVLG